MATPGPLTPLTRPLQPVRRQTSAPSVSMLPMLELAALSFVSVAASSIPRANAIPRIFELLGRIRFDARQHVASARELLFSRSRWGQSAFLHLLPVSPFLTYSHPSLPASSHTGSITSQELTLPPSLERPWSASF
ncbi:hypothetical protein LX36DRAFT_279541 [Colletotrichum falcatum]|nr:hypothetical protein LX36DRAFT_279541 [Colletotrichum falcatum]